MWGFESLFRNLSLVVKFFEKENTMFTRTISLNQYDNVKIFNAAATREENFEIDISYGRYVLNAKSLMGLFSLDLSKPQVITVHATEEEAARFLAAIDTLIIK